MADDVGHGLIAKPAWEDELMVAMPARHPALTQRRIPLDETTRGAVPGAVATATPRRFWLIQASSSSPTWVLCCPVVLGNPAVCEGFAH